MISFCQAGEVGTLADENAVPALVGQVEVALYRTSLGGLEGKEIATVGAGPRKKEAQMIALTCSLVRSTLLHLA